jgi:hypothetical protein
MRHPALEPLMILALIATTGSGCQTSRHNSGSAVPEVRAVLERQVREWNAGDLAGFMETYAKSDHTRFASGENISLGWQTVFDRYRKKYGDRSAMGTLTFSDLEITMLGPDAMLAFGRWRLKRERTNHPACLRCCSAKPGRDGALFMTILPPRKRTDRNANTQKCPNQPARVPLALWRRTGRRRTDASARSARVVGGGR